MLVSANVCDIQFWADCIETPNVVDAFLLNTISDVK